MTERHVQHVLARFHVERRVLMAFNSTGVVGWEADALVLRESGWCEEYEVKVSVADFRADARKELKHDVLRRGIPPPPRCRRPASDFPLPGQRRHHTVRRFWYAVPAALVDKVMPLVPDHAGLVSCEWDWKMTVIMPAPVLSCARKMTEEDRKTLLLSVYHRATWHRLTEGRPADP